MSELITRGGFKQQEAMQTPLVDLSQFAPEDAPLIQGIAQSLASFTSPESVMMLAGTGALGRLAKGPFGRAVSLGFTADMLSELPEQGASFREALSQGRLDDAERILGAMMVQGGAAGLAGSHAAFGGKPPRYRKGMLPEMAERMKPAKTGEILPVEQPVEVPQARRMLGEGEPINAREPRVNVEQEPIRPQPFEEPAVNVPRPTIEPEVMGEKTDLQQLRQPGQRSEPTVLPELSRQEAARREAVPQAGRSEPVVSNVPGEGREPSVEIEPTAVGEPIEKTWLPGVKPKQLAAAEPYVERLIEQKESAEEQRDVARRELEVDERTGYGSKTALKRALPAAELDPETEIASLDLANLKARNDLESPQAGDVEIKAAADAVAQASKELGIPERVFTPKGDEVFAIGPKGKMQELVDRAVEIYGDRQIGDSEYSNSIRGGVGNTLADADAAMGTMKASEKGAKFRATLRPNEPTAQQPTGIPAGRRPRSDAGNRAGDTGNIPRPAQAEIALDPARQEALDLVDTLAQQFGGKGGIPTKTNELIFNKRDESGAGVGRGLRNWVGQNIKDIPILQDVPHTKSAIENALKSRKGKIYDRIVLEAENAVRRWKEEAAAEEAAKPKGEAYEGDISKADTSFEPAELAEPAVKPETPTEVKTETKVTIESVAKGMADVGAENRKQAEAELIRTGRGKNTRRMGEVKGPLFGNEEPKVQTGLFGEKPRAKQPSGEATAGGFRKGLEDAPRDLDYQRLDRARVEMPELVELSQAINSGKLPGLRKAMGRALGRFRHQDVDPKSGEIHLRRDIFIGEQLSSKTSKDARDFDTFKKEIIERSGIPEKDLHFTKDYLKQKREHIFRAYRKDPTLAPKVMAHELGHLIDWVADSELPEAHQIMDRGNLLGRIASLHQQLRRTMMGSIGGPLEGTLGVITKEDRTRIRKLAKDLLREDVETIIDEEIRTQTPYTPDDILAIWRNTVASTEGIDRKLYEYIAGLERPMKKQVMLQALKGKTPGPPEFPDFPQKTVSVKTGRKIVKRSKEGTPKEVAEKYRELILAEIKKRQLLDAETVRDELKAVTQYWKPFNERMVDESYRNYRYSGKELYADAFSVLMNQPDKLKDMAPQFWRGVFNYMERKPDVKESYDNIQARLGGGGGGTIPPRLGRVEDMFEEGRSRREELNKRRGARVEDAKNWLMRKLIDRNQGALKSIRKGEKQGGLMEAAAKEARYDLEEIQYLASEAGNYLEDIGSKILQPLRKAGLSPDQLGAYQFLNRIAEGERELMGNPLGYTEETARKTLEGMKTEIGAEKFGKLEKAAAEFRRLREDLIIPRAEASGIYSPELIELMKDHKAYVRFGVSHWLDKTYGPGVSARVFKQVGTLSGIENPLVVTALQDLAVLRSAKVNESKRSLIDHFRLNDPEAFTPAEMKWDANVGARVPKEPANPRQALLTYLDAGKPVHVYVSKAIAQSYEAQAFEATKIAEVMASSMSLLRDVMVGKNPLWMARNVFRDIRQTYKNLPDIGALSPKDAARLARAYNDAFKESWRYVMRGERSQDIGEMQRGRMLLPGRAYEAREQSFENELERQAAEFLVDTGAVREATGARAKLKRFWDALGKFGRVSEISGKIAGYKYLKPGWRDPKEVAHVVRSRVGTPDVKRQGEAQALTNNVFLFSNVNKEGWRSSWESFNEDRSGYAWKTVAANFLPKLLLAAGAAGLGSVALKRIIDGMSEYDKANYTAVPIGLDKNGKSIYLRIPEDYEGQFWGALAWKLAHGRVLGKGGAVNLVAEQVPWSPTKLNPYLKVGGDLLEYYGYGNNPTDEWRGRPVLTDQEFAAGGSAAAKGMAKHTWRELGGTVLYDPARNELIKTKTLAEELLRSFPGNILGTFLKISDQGIADRLREVSQSVRQEKASGTIDVQQRIQRSINSAVKAKGQPDRGDMRQLFLELRREGKLSKETSEGEFQSRYFRWAARVPGNTYVEAIVNAASNAEKERLLMEYRKILSPGEYQKVLGELMRARTQSPKSLMKVEKQSRSREPIVHPGQ